MHANSMAIRWTPLSQRVCAFADAAPGCGRAVSVCAQTQPGIAAEMRQALQSKAPMSPSPLSSTHSAAESRLGALSRWDNEGGAGPGRTPAMDALHAQTPPLSNAELIQLRVRMIALENVTMVLLAQASQSALVQVRTLAEAIQPREGYTQHPLTLHAAAQMLQLVERAAHLSQAEMPSPAVLSVAT